MARIYLPPELLSRIPIDRVPTRQAGDLINLVVAKSNPGDVTLIDHGGLLDVLCEEALKELAALPSADGVTLELGDRRLWTDPDADPEQENGIYLVTSPPTPDLESPALSSNTDTPKRSEEP